MATAAAVLLALAVGLLLYFVGGLSGLELSTLSARFAVRDRPRPQNIVIVAIDERTFRELQLQWPFPRSLHAEAVDRLHAAGVREIVYDVQFTEPTTPKQDDALINAIGRAGGAVLATTVTNGKGATDVLGGDATLARIHSQAGWSAFPLTGGGVIERMPYQVDGLRSMAVLAAARASGRVVDPARYPSDGALIDYQGPPRTFKTVSFGDLVRGHVNPALLRGTVAVVGATAPSLQDVHSTPTGFMAGPELQANAIWTALNGAPLRSASDTVAVLAIVLLAAVAPLGRLRARPLVVSAGAVAIGAAYAVAAQLAFDAGSVMPVVAPLMALAIGTAGMVISSQVIEATERRRLAHLLYESQLELIHRLGQAADSRDQHTGEHLLRIGRLTRLLGLAAGMTAHEAELLRHASLMHDIGKIGIPDSILLKAGPLEPEEREMMQTHTSIGGDVLSGSELALVQMAEAVARTHHERWDGSGYPAGLRGEEIPIEGRICSICDVFDALVTARLYKPAWSVEDAVAELQRLSGQAFDPRLTETFVALVPTLDPDLLAPSSEVATPEPSAPRA
jgi:HD-GYP domain-containing protein (c-di-GMP phosphodiesterase class II)